MYDKEINAIKKANRYRQRTISNEFLIDAASNDYLGLASNRVLFDNAYQRVAKHSFHAPKSSLLVNGYTSIHQEFEKALCQANGFEEGIVLGSGFLANLSLIEALVRKKDILFMDEEYHASGMVATRLLNKSQVLFFKHNDAQDLKHLLEQLDLNKYHRIIIAIEGVYSMHGDIASKEIFDLADEYDALLIVDEAHSSGVIGENLLGVFDYYNIVPKHNHIKMGTLGKAYGSYGAYILASFEIIDFLLNKAKAIIYTTALSLFDTALGHESLNFILAHKKEFKTKIQKNLQIIKEHLHIPSQSLIIPITVGDNQSVLEIQKNLKTLGFAVGAIRQPTVKKAIIRVIAKTDIAEHDLINLSKYLYQHRG
ncbi:MAG: aminotransferase class I/II-fold pyridoxal phosphate-dependent enzyme [Arcobacteraceae bacterium]